MGLRCKRFALVAEDGKVTHIAIDESGLSKTSAEAIIEFLQ